MEVKSVISSPWPAAPPSSWGCGSQAQHKFPICNKIKSGSWHLTPAWLLAPPSLIVQAGVNTTTTPTLAWAMSRTLHQQEIFNVQNHTRPKISTICMQSFVDICSYFDFSLDQGSYLSTKYRICILLLEWIISTSSHHT